VFENELTGLVHGFVGWLLTPVLIGLTGVVAVAAWEIGTALTERAVGLRRLRLSGSMSSDSYWDGCGDAGTTACSSGWSAAYLLPPFPRRRKWREQAANEKKPAENPLR
jgi:hypothetical protein